jgi:hypothetical protein
MPLTTRFLWSAGALLPLLGSGGLGKGDPLPPVFCKRCN